MAKNRQLKIYLSYIIVLVFSLFHAKIMFAEGSATVTPTSSTNCALGLLPSTFSGSYLGCSTDNRIYFRVSDHTIENLYYGFDWRIYSPSVPNPSVTTVYMKIFNPSGVQVGTDIQLPNTGAGYINNWTEANNGPNIAGSAPLGYTPLTFDPSENGEFWVELYRSSDGGLTQMAGVNWSFAPFFDLTISSSSGVRKNGRVHCNKWSFVAIDPTNFNNITNGNAEPILYSYSSDGVVMKIDYEDGFRPLAFNVVLNKYGSQDNGNFLLDRNSIITSTVPLLENGYKLFLNKPDSTIYTSSAIPSAPTLVSPMIIGCSAPYKVRYSLPDSGDVKLLFDLNGVPGYQTGTTDRLFEILNATQGLNTFLWDGLDATATSVNLNTSFNIEINYLKGRYNLPIYDGEINKNGFRITTIRPIINNNTVSFWNDAMLTNVGSVCTTASNNGNNITGLGLDNSKFGSVSPMHAWSGDGNFSQSIPAPVLSNEADVFQCNDYGNSRIINTWGWGITTKDTFPINFNCLTISGTIWNDVNGSANGTNSGIFTTGETGTNLTNTLYATLIDPIANKVIQSVAVQSNGTYTITNVPADGLNMQVRLTNSLGVVDNNSPAVATLPSGWAKTSPLFQLATTTISNLINIDFGVVNINPVKDSFATNQNTILSNTVATNDIVIPNSTFTKVGNPTKGILAMNTNGSFTYTPNANVYGLDSIKYSVCSPSPIVLCDTATIIFNILPTNYVLAVNDLDTTTINTSKSISVLTNDSNPDGNGTLINNPTIVVNPLHGTVSVNSNGTILYTPTTGYIGTDNFQYRITDNGTPQAADTALVNLYIYKPTQNAIDDITTSLKNTLVNGNVSTNDVVVSGSTFSILGTPTKGSIAMTSAGLFTFTPTANAFGTDSVRYIVCSPSPMNICDTAKIYFAINSINAVDDLDTTTINTPKTIAVKTNDNDPQGNTISNPTIVVNPLHGTVSVNSNGTILYTPTTGYIGTDNFQYRITDNGTPQASDTALVNLYIYKPTQNAIDDNTTSLKNALVNGNVSTNDVVVSGSTYSILGTPTKGTISMTSAGAFTFTPTANAIGIDSVSYIVCSPSPMNICDTAKIYFSINSINAVDDLDTTTINTPKTIAVKTNDNDPQGNTISNPSIVVNPLHGTVSVNSNGTILYTPTTGYIGTDNFQYRITDNGTPQASDTALVNLYIYKPTQNAIDDNTTSLKNAVVNGNVSTNDVVVSGSTYSILGTPTKGTITMTSAGVFTFTPTANAIGIDSVRYIVCSPSPMNLCDTAKIYFSINSINAVDDLDTTTINTPKTIAVKTNDNDPQGNTISNPTIVVNPLHGTVSVNSNGTILYTPTTGYIGTDNFQYRITDNGTPQAADTALVSLYIYKPTFFAIADINSTTMGVSISGNVSTNDYLISGTSFAKIGNATNGTLIMNSNGTYTYTPNLNFIGKDKIDYVITSPAPMNIKDTSTLIINVTNNYTNGNNSIIAFADHATMPINQSVQICVVCNDVDPQNDSISTPLILANPSNGTVTVNSNKTITYIPNSNFVGSDKFSYIICDNNSTMACDTSEVFVDVSSLSVLVNQTYANDDVFYSIVGTQIQRNLSNNDTDPQNDNTTFAKVGNPSHGVATVNSNGTFTYIPNANYEGTDIFTYSKCDNGSPSSCDTATVYITMLKLNITLPVIMESFEIAEHNCNIFLNWKTSEETNVSHFEIERKNNNNIFELIGTLNAVGNSQEINSYNFIDNKAKQGLNEYRLKIIDVDNKFNYSESKIVNMNCTKASDISVFPNPAINVANVLISSNSFEQFEINLIDATGRIIYKNNFDIDNESKIIQIPMNSFSNGIYSISINNGFENKVFRLVKTE